MMYRPSFPSVVSADRHGGETQRGAQGALHLKPHVQDVPTRENENARTY